MLQGFVKPGGFRHALGVTLFMLGGGFAAPGEESGPWLRDHKELRLP